MSINRYGISRRKTLKLLGVSGLALAAPGIVRAQTNRPKEIGIAGLCSLSGPATTFGVGGRNSFEVRVAEVNAAGGLWGDGNGMLRLDLIDDQSKPDIAVSELARAARTKDVVGVTVLAPSASTIQATIEGERQRLSVVNTASAAPEINSRGLKYAFSTCPDWNGILRSSLGFIDEIVSQSDRKPTKAAFIYENKFAGPSARRAMDNAMAQGSLFKVEGDYPYDPATTDFGPLVARLKADGVDFPIIYSYPQDGILLMRAIREQSYEPLALTGIQGSLGNVEFADALGKTAEFVMGQSNYVYTLKAPGNAEYVQAFKAKAGRAPDNVAGQAYNGFSAFVVALKTAEDPLDRDSVREALSKLKIAGGTENVIIPGGIAIDEKGANPAAQGCFYQIRNGVHEAVRPVEFATAELVYPRGDWASYAQ